VPRNQEPNLFAEQSELQRLAIRYRGALIKRDNEAINNIVHAYGSIYKKVSSAIDALTMEIGQMETPNTSRVKSLARYKQLMSEINTELEKFSVYAKVNLSTYARSAMEQGIKDSMSLVKAANPSILGKWRVLTPDVISNLTGYLDDTSPIYKRLAKLAPETVDLIRQSILDGVAMGYNPKKIADGITKNMGLGLTSAMRYTQTTQIYSYREANRASYIANSDVVEGWYWMSARDDRVCMSCLAMDGTFHTNDETLDDHWNGHCTMIPAVVGTERSIPEGAGEEYFKGLSEAEQRKMMGDTRYDAWRSGKFEFGDQTQHVNDTVFGVMRGQTPLKDLIPEEQ
jgi:hypothetical protein